MQQNILSVTFTSLFFLLWRITMSSEISAQHKYRHVFARYRSRHTAFYIPQVAPTFCTTIKPFFFFFFFFPTKTAFQSLVNFSAVSFHVKGRSSLLIVLLRGATHSNMARLPDHATLGRWPGGWNRKLKQKRKRYKGVLSVRVCIVIY